MVNLLWPPSPGHPALASGEARVYAFELDSPDAQIASMAGLLSLEEKKRAAALKVERVRRRYLCGRAMLRKILGCHLGCDGSLLSFSSGPQGKPSLAPGQGRIHFNVSGSHGLGVLALHLDDEIGIDVEHVRPLASALGIAKRFFSEEDYQRLRALPSSKQSESFFRLWTSKEAMIKSVGLGLWTRAGDRILREGRASTEEHWGSPLPDPSRGYVAALATAAPPNQLHCWTWFAP